MPTIITRGAASARGFGFGSGPQVCAKDGTKAIFALGYMLQYNPAICAACYYTTTTRNKYTYATCTSTACGVGAASTASRAGSAAGNGSRAIFTLGNTYRPVCSASGSATSTRNKYTYATCTSTACGVASASLQGSGGSAAGNSTRGIFAIGQSSNPTARNKYTYSTCTSAATTSFTSYGTWYGSAAGTSTKGIFAIGNSGNSYCTLRTAREKYTYACDTATTSGVGLATFRSYQGAAAGNKTIGMFALGYLYCSCPCGPNGMSVYMDKYTYATCTSTLTGYLPETAMQMSAAGNSTRGIFNYRIVGTISKRNKYTYATNSNAAVGIGSTYNFEGSAASWQTCVNCGA